MMAFLSALPEPLVPAAAVAPVESELAARGGSGAGGPGQGQRQGTRGSPGGAWGENFLRALSPAQHNTFLYVV